MRTRTAARLAAEETAALETAPAREVLLSGVLWPSLDAATKAALRGVSRTMRRLVDGSVVVVASPNVGISAAVELASALVRWPGVRHLTLLGVINAEHNLLPLNTLTRLTSLTVHEGEVPGDPAWPMLMFSSSVAAMLRVVDFSYCAGLCSIGAMRNCAQLRILWMPGCFNVSDLSPLAACSATLEELWMANDKQITSLAPLKACTRLRKLDICGCNFESDEVEDLQLACPQLADPASVVVEGLVHDLQPGILPVHQSAAVEELTSLLANADVEMHAAIATAGAIPRLVRLLGRDLLGYVQRDAAELLSTFAQRNAENQAAIAAAGAIPALVQILGRELDAVDVHEAATRALGDLADNHADNQDAIVSFGAILLMVKLLGPSLFDETREDVAQALLRLARNDAENQAAFATAGAIPALVQLASGSSSIMQATAQLVLGVLADENAGNQAKIDAAGAIPSIVQLLGPLSPRVPFPP
ncbi:hypothetical protein FOA52_013205 [Chlamydomonas sp. UWO 241]|nr:hypothetical protein FOA52_013205 [Chlamydomonas sp. UWO 241]